MAYSGGRVSCHLSILNLGHVIPPNHNYDSSSTYEHKVRNHSCIQYCNVIITKLTLLQTSHYHALLTIALEDRLLL